MGIKRPTGSARLEQQLIEGWKRYATRRLGSAQSVAEGSCYLESRPCPFEARADFESRFAKDCVHCPRLQGAAERAGVTPAGSSGVLPTLPLLLGLVEESGEAGSEGAGEDGRYRAASLLLRALPMIHASGSRQHTARLLLAAVAGAFSDVIDTALYFEVSQESTALRLEASFRHSDLEGPERTAEGYLDAESLESAGAFDSPVFDALRDSPLPIDEDRDLLADAVYDGRTAVVLRPGRELRLPARLIEHLPDGPAAILPVFGRERVSGLLVVSAAPGIAGWTSDQIELLSGVASQAGIALDGATMSDVARRRAAGVRAVAELAEGELSASRPERWSEPTLQSILAALGAQVLVAWNRGDAETFSLAASTGEPLADENEVRELGDALKQWFEADPRPILISSLSDDPRLPGTFPGEWGAALAVPLRAAGALHGAFVAVRTHSGEPGAAAAPFDVEDARIASLVASALTLGALRAGEADRLARSERRSGELEAQLKHADKLAVVGERGILVAQEIRNPIAAITGFARRVLRALGEGDPNREYLEIILRETERLERILTEQVSMAQMTRPRLKLQSLNALVQEVLELQSEELVRRRVRLLKRLSPDVPSLLIDNDKMRQVLLNIVQHALQSVPSGGRVRVETRTGPGVVHAEIAHDGPKIAGESLDRLFVPFHSSRRYGAGVGLAVAYQIVREHGGEIRAKSEGDWSSIVTIYLPVRENQDRRGKPDRRGGKNDRRRRMA